METQANLQTRENSWLITDTALDPSHKAHLNPAMENYIILKVLV